MVDIHMKPGRGKMYSGFKSNGEPDVVWWLSQLRKGLTFRKKAAFETEWETWRRYYRGDYNSGTLPLNIFFKMVRTLVPRVYFRDPSISISPSLSGDENYVFAQILERIDNKLIRKMRVKEAIKAMTQNAFMFGTGIGKLGYGAQYTLTPDILETVAPDGKKRGDRVEYDDRVSANMPWFMPCHPGDFVVPVGCSSIHSARWVAHFFTRHIDDIKEDPRYKNTSDLDKLGESRSHEMVRGELIQNKTRPMPEGTVELFEFRDKKTERCFVIAPYNGMKCLYIDDDDMLHGGKFPFFPLIFNADDLYFWGIPDAKILDPQQRELNEIRTKMMQHRRLSVLKVMTQIGSISPDELQKMTSEEVGPVIQFLSEQGLASAKMIDLSNIPQGLVTMDALVEKDVQEILGLGNNQFGEYAPGSADRSATEAQIVNQATQIRMDERRDAVADLLVDLCHQWHEIIFERWDGDKVVDLVGPGGVKIWVEFQPQELRNADYNINIDPDSTLPVTKQQREQKALQVYGILSSNPLIDPHKLTAYLLREFHGVEYDDMMLNPQQAEQLAQQRQQAQAVLQAHGAQPGQPMKARALGAAMPQLRSIQGGARR